jgi:hypothetical protein
MKIAAALLACLASANAFATVRKASSSSALQMSVFDDYEGAVDFRGKKFEFDPVRDKFSVVPRNVCVVLRPTSNVLLTDPT